MGGGDTGGMSGLGRLQANPGDVDADQWFPWADANKTTGALVIGYMDADVDGPVRDAYGFSNVNVPIGAGTGGTSGRQQRAVTSEQLVVLSGRRYRVREVCDVHRRLQRPRRRSQRRRAFDVDGHAAARSGAVPSAHGAGRILLEAADASGTVAGTRRRWSPWLGGHPHRRRAIRNLLVLSTD